jgi:transglutaminase-like putative cysteine protease
VVDFFFFKIYKSIKKPELFLSHMRFGIVVIILFIVSYACFPIAFGTDFSTYEDITMDVSLTTSVDISPKVSQYSVEYINVNLSFIPYEDSFQVRKRLETNPEAQEEVDHIIFTLTDPIMGNNPLELKSTVKVSQRVLEVKKKVHFPIGELDSYYTSYTKATETIDANNQEIIKRANELASGEDDLIKVLHKIGEFVYSEITYDNSETFNLVSGTKKASWVLSNKIGVCDEYSTLFIALARALRIPAKYVSGVAYTNYQNLNNWGPHAWAEVYIPNYGWMTYDVTYGQFMFADASHIKLKESYDADESSINYEWRARNIDVQTNAMNIDTVLKEKGKHISPFVSLEVTPIKEKVGFESYNLIEIEVENLHDYYVSARVQLAETRELDLIDSDYDIFVLLEPNEKKNIYIIVKLKPGLKDEFIYTIPTFIKTVYNASAQGSFSSTNSDPVYSLQDMKDLKEGLKPKNENSILKDISIACASKKGSYYTYESGQLTCDVKNSGNAFLTDVSICMKNSCKKIDVGIGRTEQVTFDLDMKKTGDIDYTIRAEKNDVSASTMINIQVLDEPRLNVASLDHPEEIRYDESFTVGTNVKKTSYSVPQNVSLYYYIKDIMVAEMHSVELELDHNFQLQMTGKDIMGEQATLRIDIIYYDKNGKKYTDEASTTIALKDVSLVQKILLFMAKIEMKIASFF